MEEQNDDEITIDFSKIMGFFKKKTEKDKVKDVEKKAEEVKVRIEEKIKEDKREDSKLKESEEKINEIRDALSKQEHEAEIIDAEKKLVKRSIEKEKKDIERIRESSDDEISVDFSKIKNFFRNIGKGISQDKSQKSDDDISFDSQKAIGFIKKYHIILLILIPFFLSVYLRVMPSYLPITDDWARSSVYNNIRQQISSDVMAQYPNLPEANINKIVDSQLNQLLKDNKAQVEEQITQVSDYFKSRLKDDNGQTYLLAIDPYFWMRHAKNILESGHPGDELRNIKTRKICYEKSAECVPWDNHMYAPLGREVPPDMFHAYFEAYLHKFLAFFNPAQDLMATAFIIPIILSAICVVPAFFIARRLSGNFGGFVAALVVAFHTAFLTRTAGGFSDTDAYNVLFPLFITWLFLEAFETKDLKKGGILSIISGLLVGVYTRSWGGWWYIFDFLLASIVIYTLFYLFVHRFRTGEILKQDVLKNTAIIFMVFFFSSMIFVSLISGFGDFKGAFTGPMSFVRLKEVGITTIWPNVFTTVAEQNPASLDNVINQIGTGSLLLFLLSIVGIILTLTKKDSKDKKDLYYVIISSIWVIMVLVMKPSNLIVFLVLISLPVIVKILMAVYNKNTKIDFKLAIILIIWFTSTLYASTKGVRFMLILVPAFSLGIGIAFGLIYKYASGLISKSLYLSKAIVKSVLIVLLLLLLLNPINVSRATAKQEIPSMNDAWYNSLDKINKEAERDAIINSWWDFGHWFKAVGNRAVTFDGTSQNSPMAHWIGHALLTNDEDDAVGILRMLDCGSNNAFDALDKYIQDPAKSVKIIHDIVKLSKQNAKNYLKDYVAPEQADEVLKYTHCAPPEDYFITSDDMIGKSGVWAHFGIWSFDRALIYNTLKKKEYKSDLEKSKDFLKKRFNYSDDIAESLYYEVQNIKNSDEANSWIAPWPSYASGLIACQTKDENMLACPLNMQGVQGSLIINVDIKQRKAVINTPMGDMYPNSIVFPTEEGIKKVEYNNNTIGYSMTLIPSENSWGYIMVLPPLEDSMFTRLYFLDGHGLTKFRKFSDERSVVGNRIIVWKVDWEGDERNMMSYFSKTNESSDSNNPVDEQE